MYVNYSFFFVFFIKLCIKTIIFQKNQQFFHFTNKLSLDTNFHAYRKVIKRKYVQFIFNLLAEEKYESTSNNIMSIK